MMADDVRILITGNSGSGKTWLGERLSERLTVPLVRLDDVYWQDAYGGKERDKQVVFDEVAERATEGSWVMEGVYGWLLPAALPRATEFIFLDLPLDECLDNVRRRGGQAIELSRERENASDRHGQHPLNSGRRFWLKASTPSMRSCVETSRL